MWLMLAVTTNRRVKRVFEEFFKIIAFFLFFFHLSITTVKSSALEVGFGKGSFCTSDEECDQSRFLQCIGNSCNCRAAFGISWVDEENSCMLMEGAPCGRSLDEPKCITNSSCVAGKCECTDEYLRNGFGVCELSYGNVCSKGERCAVRYLLECAEPSPHDFVRQKTCQCKGEGIEFVWDVERRKCVSKAGIACDTKDHPGFGRDDQLECIENAECVEPGFCKCKDGFTQTPDGTCLLQYGQKCISGQGPYCNRFEHLVCQQGKCSCEFYGQLDYDNETHQCRILVGESCIPRNENQVLHEQTGNSYYQTNGHSLPSPPMCVKDAFCKPRRGSQRGKCVCLPGFETSPSGKCTKDRGHGLPCSSSVDCDRSQFLECVINNEGLGFCNCLKNHMYFDGKQCRVYPGKSCSENRLCADNSYCEGEYCVCNANQGYEIVDKNFNECTLVKRNMSPTPTTPTSVDYNHAHSSDYLPNNPYSAFAQSCDDFQHGTLLWKRCQCQKKISSHIWLEQSNSCAALVGTECKADYQCIPNAICDLRWQTCQCAVDAHTMSDRTCRRSTTSEHSLHDHKVRDCDETHSKTTASGVQQELYSNSAKGFHFEPVTKIWFTLKIGAVIMIQYCLHF